MAKQALTSLFRQAEFFLSTHDASAMPPEAGVEVAFAGRSNSGKSTAINAIVRRKGLAHASKTPGRTQAVNFFSLGPHRYLVDLPGYGYAKVPREEINRWRALLSAYIARRSLRGLILVMDIRQPLTALDMQLLEWIAPRRLACHVLLTKTDKLARRHAESALSKAEQTVGTMGPQFSVQTFSGRTGLGAEAARRLIAEWLGTNKKPPVKGE